MTEPLPVPDSPREYVDSGGRLPADGQPSASSRRGKLKIFFGAFPGVGKTYAMLVAGERLKHAGRDVVIGVVDTHGDPEADALLGSFEIVPPPVADGRKLAGEMDLDAILRRAPDVALVDELAHGNPEGFRHPHRWNDVDEILAAGINVFTTMSVQELESLTDVVGEITGIPAQKETVPDTFFDSAEETVVVDMSADELLARLRAGQVRSPEVGEASAAKFFRKGNLLALRELALRRTADVVEDEVQKYRIEQAIGAVWKTQGHLLCCIGPSEGSEHVVRSAARLANQLDVRWTAVYVETPRLQRLPAPERARILQVVSLAGELGARTAILTGNDASEAILEYARSENISTIVVGRSPRGPRLHVLRSLSEKLADRSDDIDLIEIGAAGRETGPAVAAPKLPLDAASPRAAEKRLRYAWATGICAAVTLANAFLDRYFELTNIAMTFVFAVILVAVWWGRGPAIYASLLSVLALDFFFVPPLYSFRVSDPEYFLTFVVMLALGAITGQLAGNLRFQARVASHRERRARTLYEFARDLTQKRTTAEVIEATEQFMSRHFRGRVAVLVPDATGQLVSPTGRGMTNPFDGTTAQWAYDQSKPAGAGTDTMASNEHLFLPLRSPTRTRGVLAIRPERARDLMIPEQRHQFDIFAALVATALERVHYVDVARDALLMARIQSRDMQLEVKPHPLVELVEGAVRSLGPTLAKHPVTLDVPRDLVVPADARLVERVFMSLIGNVPKHTPAGTGVTVAARAAGDFAEVSVTDDGPGLPRGREEEIFESFTRGDDTQSPKRGAGLGLSIVRAIVEAHGGSIHAQKGREKGARILFTLPLKKP